MTGASPAFSVDPVIGEDRWAANRLARLGTAERRLYAAILRSLAQGQPPAPPEPSREGMPDGPLRTLVERDLVQLAPDHQIVAAYPFSARPTRHLVRLREGQSYWAMCAIDALGIPYMLHEPAEIEAREPDTDRPITVSIDPDASAPRWTPAEAVVVAARSGPGCSAGCACPHINLFASKTAGERYLALPELSGAVLSVPDATAVGRRLFGDLLDALDPAP